MKEYKNYAKNILEAIGGIALASAISALAFSVLGYLLDTGIVNLQETTISERYLSVLVAIFLSCMIIAASLVLFVYFHYNQINRIKNVQKGALTRSTEKLPARVISKSLKPCDGRSVHPVVLEIRLDSSGVYTEIVEDESLYGNCEIFDPVVATCDIYRCATTGKIEYLHCIDCKVEK